MCESSRPFLERFRAFEDVLAVFPGSDLLVYTPAEFENMRRTRGFVERAEREGVLLYEAPKAS